MVTYQDVLKYLLDSLFYILSDFHSLHLVCPTPGENDGTLWVRFGHIPLALALKWSDMRKTIYYWCSHGKKATSSDKMIIVVIIQGSNLDFHALTFARSHGRCWKPWPEATVFNTSQGTWQMLMHWKTMFDRYYCIKTENICYIWHYFLHYFVSLFHRCLADVISMDYAPSRAGQYTSRDGSYSVAPVQAYWKLRSRALTACELPC